MLAYEQGGGRGETGFCVCIVLVEETTVSRLSVIVGFKD